MYVCTHTYMYIYTLYLKINVCAYGYVWLYQPAMLRILHHIYFKLNIYHSSRRQYFRKFSCCWGCSVCDIGVGGNVALVVFLFYFLSFVCFRFCFCYFVHYWMALTSHQLQQGWRRVSFRLCFLCPRIHLPNGGGHESCSLWMRVAKIVNEWTMLVYTRDVGTNGFMAASIYIHKYTNIHIHRFIRIIHTHTSYSHIIHNRVHKECSVLFANVKKPFIL